MQNLNIEIMTSEEADDTLPVEIDRLREYAVHVLSGGGVASGDFNIVFIDNAYMTELNEGYKGREGATDVLSFDLSDETTGEVSGEVYISLERAKAQAGEFGVSFEEEVVRLVTHGLLHLTGQVHDTDERYDAMMARTERLVREFFTNRGTD